MDRQLVAWIIENPLVKKSLDDLAAQLEEPGRMQMSFLRYGAQRAGMALEDINLIVVKPFPDAPDELSLLVWSDGRITNIDTEETDEWQ